MCDMIILVRSVFNHENQYYPQLFVDERFFKLEKWETKI